MKNMYPIKDNSLICLFGYRIIVLNINMGPIQSIYVLLLSSPVAGVLQSRTETRASLATVFKDSNNRHAHSALPNQKGK